VCGLQEGQCARRPMWKKMWNPRWQPRNCCDGRLIVKILITTFQANLCCLFHVSPPNSPELWLLKLLLLTYHHSHFLAATLDFTSFFPLACLGAAHFFYSWPLSVFVLDFTSFCNCILQSWHIVVVTYLFSLYRQLYATLNMCIMHTFF